FPGAEAFAGPYSDGNLADGIGHFETDEKWMERLKPDVLICFFGFNEAFLGRSNLANYRAELDAFLKHTLKTAYNGKAAPQVALVSPTAYQDITAHVDVPNGKRQNGKLAAYATVMETVAARNNVLFINAFNASLGWYKAGGERLTADGALLNDAGYQKFAPFLIDSVFGEAPEKAASHKAKVHAAVMEKNWFWINDFKIPNGVHVFGRRYNPFGPKNYPFEIEKIRQMTEIRDQAIWAALDGKTIDIAAFDKKTAPLPPVQTNFRPGGKNGALEFLRGKAALDTIKVPEGYKLQQWATEQEFPNLQNPVQMAFDNRGRLWVSVMPSYPHYRPGDPLPDDKLLIYEDTDGDGKADKEIVWADSLHLPMGFEISHDGVYVSQGVNLVLLKDTDGDDKADTKEVVFSGFDDHDTHHAIGAYCADPSGAFIMNEGVFLRTNVETAYGTVRGTNGGFYRFDPNRRKLERHAQLSIPNPWGVAFDRWGQHFFLHTSGPTVEWMLPGSVKPRYGVATPKSRHLLERAHSVRPTSGIEFMSSRHFPDETQGDLLLNNTIGFRGTKQHAMSEDGTGYVTKWRHDMTVSTDGNYRPVDLEIGPDGSLFIVDWHNPLIGHMQHNARDPNRDHAHGRIYRVTYPSRPLVKPAKIAGAPIEQLLDNLKLPEYRSRYRTRRELRGRNVDEVLSAVTKWVGKLDPAGAGYEHHKLEALWVTWGLNRVDQALLKDLLKAKDHRARAAAVRVLRYTGHQVKDQVALIEAASADPHGRVKLEAIVAASWLPKNKGLKVLATARAAAEGKKAGPEPEPVTAGAVKVSQGGALIEVADPKLKNAMLTGFTITLPGNKRTINLMEMEIHAGGRNISSQATVAMSSTFRGGSYPIKHLTDGNKDTMAHSRDGDKNPKITVKFAQPTSVDKVVIWNRKGYEGRFHEAKFDFLAGKKKVSTAVAKMPGGNNGGGGPNDTPFDDWIASAYRTSLAHLNGQTIESKEEITSPGHLSGGTAKAFVRGGEIYRREGHCGTCHQPDGKGLSAAGFPPLAGARWATQSTERLIKITLHGLHGPIEVNGHKYPGLVPMTPFKGLLNDQEIADTLTYVRNAFGNKSSPVSAAEVKKVRDATSGQVGFYSPQQVLKEHPHE
ncbi:MAG: c-type cytochrome, partial [Phycisphaerae bacterium]|nr:c-type cytochrome [Phycisphaerae bacterium]